MKKPEKQTKIRLKPRDVEAVTIQIPKEALAALKEIAASKDMSYEALLKFYIGQSLRKDLAKRFSDRVMKKTEKVLTRHLQSEEEVAAILQEIRDEAVA